MSLFRSRNPCSCVCSPVFSLAEKGDEPPAKLLDDLFLKTKAAPCIYWLPLTEEQVGPTHLCFQNLLQRLVFRCRT